ncbi:MAG: hypothetical protein U0586_13650 [Candidatus Brocadiaceae bacterium]
MEQKTIYVGIDWADDHYDIFITDDSAKTLDQFRIDHACEGFAMLHSHIANHQTSPDLVLIAIETSRGILSCKKATSFMPSIPKQSTATRIGMCFQRQNLTLSTPCRLVTSCAQTITCFNRFPKIIGFLKGFAAAFVKWLMKGQDSPIRLFPA